MLQAHHRTFSGTIRTTDTALLVVSAAIASRWPGPIGAAVGASSLFLQIAVLALAWLAVAARTDLYQSRRTEDVAREVEALGLAVLLSTAITALVGLAFYGGLGFHPLAAAAFGFGLLALLRCVIRGVLRMLRVRGFNYRYAILVGAGRSAAVLHETLRANRHYGIRVLGCVPLEGEQLDPGIGLRDLREIGDLRAVLSEFAIDLVLLCPSHDARNGEILETFNTCDVAGIHCHYAPSFFSLRGLHPSIAWYGALPAFDFESSPRAPLRLGIKRAIDVVASGIGIIVLSPVLIGCALAVWVYDRGPIFFKQVRVGINGHPFHCLKFRSMCLNAEEKLAELQAANEEDGPVFKMKNDPRITPAGRFLRKYSLDELPQLFNVLKGDMSLVGPRPPIPAEVEEYDWWQRRRLSVRPGITCIWQVFGRNKVPFERWMEMDLQYIDNWSLTMDVKLLARTVHTVFKGTGC